MSVRVELGRQSSDLFQGDGSRRRLIECLTKAHKRWVVLTDEEVRAALEPRCPELFSGLGVLSVPAGEESKSLANASELWGKLCELGADRSTAVLAVGGGMVTDLAGFVASTYLRGLPFYSCPTSLLAMVDASVGGKVGIDLPEGKNLVGSFYPATAVAVDPQLLDTLPQSEWASGMAEVIKHGVLAGDDLWNSLLRGEKGQLQSAEGRAKLLEEAVAVKLQVVVQDPYEKTGLRATLNLGHTFGHALEWSSEFELRHGEAVGLGMLAAVRLSRTLGILQVDFESELLSLLERWSLPTTLPGPQRACWNWEPLRQAFGRDKKASAGEWNFILPIRPGRVLQITAPDPALVRAAVESLKEPSGVNR